MNEGSPEKIAKISISNLQHYYSSDFLSGYNTTIMDQ